MKSTGLTISACIADQNLLGHFLGPTHNSWAAWFCCLRAIYGGLSQAYPPALARRCTGRTSFPPHGFDTALLICGRRSGKSRIAAVIAAYESALAGNEAMLAKGEKGVVSVSAPTKEQSKIVHGYIRSIFSTPLLAAEVVGETQTSFELRSGVSVEVCTGDHKTIRGRTLLAAVVDEAAFFGTSEDAKCKSDVELIRAIKPGLALTGGKLIAITSPYAKKGWTYKTWERHFGNDASTGTLVWVAPSTQMNPTMPQSVVDQAIQEDLQAAKSEYLAEWREDLVIFLPREVIEAVVAKGRQELLPRAGTFYSAFCDVSGGRSDSAALAIGHSEDGGKKVVMDLLRIYKAPFDPQAVVALMVQECKRFGVRRIVGDNYAAEYTNRAFTSRGIGYVKCDKPKSALYGEMLPRICSQGIELLDDETLISQLSNLERRTRSGGKDQIDHATGAHDDAANAAAGLAYIAGKKRLILGAFGGGDEVAAGRRVLANLVSVSGSERSF